MSEVNRVCVTRFLRRGPGWSFFVLVFAWFAPPTVVFDVNAFAFRPQSDSNESQVPSGYVGKWKGISGKAHAQSRGRVGTAIVNKDYGHIIDEFEFEVSADGTVSGSGKASYWFDVSADADLIVSRVAPESHLKDNIQQVPFKISGTMTAGRAKLVCTPDYSLVLINAGNEQAMDAWNVFSAKTAHVMVDDSGALTVGISTTIEELGMKLEWEAKKCNCPNPLDVGRDMSATRFNGWTYGSSARQNQVDCVQFVLAVVEELHKQPIPAATRQRILISDVTAAELQALVQNEDPRIKGIQTALVDIDHGTIVNSTDAQPGDFVQYWYQSDGVWKGHASIIEDVRTENGVTKAHIYGSHSHLGHIGTAEFELNLNRSRRYVVRYKCESSHGCCGNDR